MKANHHPRPPQTSTRRGFTLLELLVTIGIIAILIGFVVAGIPRIRRAAQTTSTNAELVTIANGIQQYYNDFHSYPGPFANNQLANEPFHPTWVDPSGNTIDLGWMNGTTPQPFPQLTNITSSENLVLGLLGGLEIDTPPGNGNPVLNYNSTRIFPDNITPNPKGAMSVNYNRPKVWPAYIQVPVGYIDRPDATSMTGGVFTDNAQRAANDSIIPEFIDQYASQQMPILYLRANAGATGIVSLRGQDESGNPLVAQYDIGPIVAYTLTLIGTNQTDGKRDHHGLQGLGDNLHGIREGFAKFFDNGSSNPNPGSNAIAYFKDPSNPGPSNQTGNARQKDGFILISAGPDGVYGTEDDVIYPGSLLP